MNHNRRIPHGGAWSPTGSPGYVSKKRGLVCLGAAITTAVLLSIAFPVTKSSLIYEAIKDGNKSRLEHLLRNGNVDMTIASGLHGSPLHLAVMYGKTNIVKFLLAQGADVNAKDSRGETAMHYAVYYHSIPSATMLVSAGTDIDVMSNFGTPLHLAVGYQRKSMIKYLISIGADISLTNAQGRTAVDLAHIFGKGELLLLLNKSP